MGLGGGWGRSPRGVQTQCGETLVLPSKCTVQIEEGDTLIVHTPGGGGYGYPRRRDSQAVLRDVLNGLVSAESAEKDYAVSIRDGVVDEKQTRLLRAGP